MKLQGRRMRGEHGGRAFVPQGDEGDGDLFLGVEAQQIVDLPVGIAQDQLCRHVLAGGDGQEVCQQEKVY